MQQQEFTVHSDPSRGYTVATFYEGIDYPNALATFQFYQSIGVEVSLTAKFGVFRVATNDATQNNPIDNWEIIGNDERLDLFQNPNWEAALAAIGGALTDAETATIRYYLAQNTPPHGQGGNSGAFDTPASTLPSQYVSLVPLSGTLIERAYARYQAGNDEFLNSAYGGGYVLKHTTNVPARSTQNIADFNIGAIYSTASLLTEATNSSLWVYPLPARLVFKINRIFVPSVRPYYSVGWLKERSNEETSANNRVNIVTHYTYDQWSTDDYPISV